MLEVGIPAPALAEQVEAAVAANHKAAQGAGQEHLLVDGDIGPVRTEAHGGRGRVGRRTAICHGAGRGAGEQTRLQQIGIVATHGDAILGRVALRRGVLGAADAIGRRARLPRWAKGHRTPAHKCCRGSAGHTGPA